MSNTRPCRACGREILFAKSAATDRPIPLEKLRQVYFVDREGYDPVARPYDLEGEVFVSHFETCPQASKFTRGE